MSASTANLAGTLIFLALGAHYRPYKDGLVSVLLVTGFYLFLAIGERIGRRFRVSSRRFGRIGEVLAAKPASRSILVVAFCVLSLLPISQALASGQSLGSQFRATWATNTVRQTSAQLIEMSTRTPTPAEALIAGVQRQLGGFWYLAMGVLIARRSRVLLPAYAIYMLGSLLTSGGFRSLILVNLLVPIICYLRINRTRMRLRTVVMLVLLAVAALVALDFLRYGRQGRVAQGDLLTRVDRTLRTDFAFGGLGIELGLSNPPSSAERGLSYLWRMAVLPIPRFLWAGKPASNPNQVFTEWATGRSYAEVGSIMLFTPLGEALFVFGYAGILIVPMLYGFITSALERAYATAPAYVGLQAQAIVWGFLAMRLTLYNLFSVLVVANFVLISILVTASYLLKRRRLRTRAPMAPVSYLT